MTNQSNFLTKKIVDVHISTIKIGDTIISNDGIERTIGKGNIKRDDFIGITIFGDSYKLGYKLVKKVVHLP